MVEETNVKRNFCGWLDRFKYDYVYNRRMEKLHKQDYNALKIYTNNTRAELQVQKQNKIYNIEPEEEKRLIELGYIDWNENSKKIYRPEFIVTIIGSETFLKLKSEHTRDIKLWILIGTAIITLLKLFGVF